MSDNLSISTITEVVKTNCITNLDTLSQLYQDSNVINYETPILGIIKISFNNQSKGTCKKDTMRKKNKETKTFQNQLAIYVRRLLIKNIDTDYIGKNIFLEYSKTTTQLYHIDLQLNVNYTGNVSFYVDKIIYKTIYVEDQNKINLFKEKIIRVKRNITFKFDTIVQLDNIIFKYPHEVSIFMFASGNLKLSGIRSLDDTPEILDILWSGLNKNQTSLRNHDFKIIKRSTSLINTDFTAGYSLIRENLYKIINSNYNLEINYDPDVHPALQIRYYCNNQYTGLGRCLCRNDVGQQHKQHIQMICKGKGTGEGLGECKIVTILIFQSGKVIITGGRSMVHVQQSYTLISNILSKYKNQIIRN